MKARGGLALLLLFLVPPALASDPAGSAEPPPKADFWRADIVAPPPPGQTPKPPYDVPPGEIVVVAREQVREGPWTRLRGAALLQTGSFLIKAEEIDYNQETDEAEARGSVYLQHFRDGEELWADRVEYNLGKETGKFYNVRGSAPVQLDSKPGILTSPNPFYFEGKWAERLEDRYILYDGFITNCKMPRPWWVLQGPKFDVIPNDRALAHRTVFRVRKVPLFFTPFFYKSLERQPRKSGFLTPNIGNSSRRGKMVGAGYYWAINRSHDAMYRTQYFTQRGVAHHVDLRGKPRAGTDFNAIFYGVQDRGLEQPGQAQRRKEGGFLFSFEGRSDLGRGFYGQAEVNYLSSFVFRQAFTESFYEAISSEVHSVGFISRDWSSYGLDLAFQRQENFQSLQPDDKIVIRKLPELRFTSRDRRLWESVPVWISWDSSAGMLRRNQLLFQTRQFTERIDLYPRATAALRWKDFTLLPSFGIRGTHYGGSRTEGRIAGQNINRFAREFSLALAPPSLARIYDGPGWLGERVKHVIEPRASFRHVSGVSDFERFIRFDETELYSNTTEAELSLANRIFVKRGGNVEEVLSWQLWQRRYFDPDFGGAVQEGWCGQSVCRNVVLSAIDLTPYAFLDRPRHYSPVVSVMRMSPRPGFGLEWRSDYDPLRSKLVSSGMSADARFGKYFVSLGQTSVRSVPALSPGANQFRGLFVVGDDNRRGWNAAFTAIYDFRVGAMQFATTQVTYNTDCCGFSLQYRRLSFGTRNENQFRIAFAVANIGSFGTLKKQEKIF